MNKRSIFGFAVGPIGAAALGFISLPMSTWLFAPEDVGRISMLQTATGVCTIIFTLGLDQSFVRQYHLSQHRSALLRTVTWPGLTLLVLTTALLLAASPGFLSRQMYGIDSPLLSAITAIGVVAAFISRFSSLALRMDDRGLAFSMSQLLPKLLYVALIGLLALDDTRRFNQLLVAQTVSLVAASAIFAWNTRKSWIQTDSPAADAPPLPRLYNLLHYGLPMMAAGLAYWTLEAIDKVMLRTLSSFTELGHYSVAMGVASVAATLSTIFTTIWVPTAFKWAAEPDCVERISTLQCRLVTVAVLIIGGAGTLTFALDWLLPASYASVRELIVLCMLPALFYAVSEVTGIGAAIAHRSGLILLAAVITAAFNICLNSWLIPLWGARGAALATALSFYLMLVLRTETSTRSWRRLPRADVYIPLALGLIAASAHAWLVTNHPAAVQCLWVILLASAAWWYRAAVGQIIRHMRHREAPAV